MNNLRLHEGCVKNVKNTLISKIVCKIYIRNENVEFQKIILSTNLDI